jgi:hypothetical protein
LRVAHAPSANELGVFLTDGPELTTLFLKGVTQDPASIFPELRKRKRAYCRERMPRWLDEFERNLVESGSLFPGGISPLGTKVDTKTS